MGPGDPELMTLKAVRAIRECSVIAVPVSDGELSEPFFEKAEGKGGHTQYLERCVAYRIARGAVPEAEKKDRIFLPMPMIKEKERLKEIHDRDADAVAELLEEGKDVVFLTLGDPTVYSTCMYVHKRLKKKGYRTELIPGIPSFCSGAAAAGLPLMEGNESLVIVPSVKAGKALEDAIAGFDNVVVMKAGGSIARIGELLDQYGRPRECATVLSCVGMQDEYIGPLDPEREYSYFTTVMIKREKR